MRKFFTLLIAGALAFTAFGCHHHRDHHDRHHGNPPVVTRPAPQRPAPRPAPNRPLPPPRPGQPAPVIVVPQPHRESNFRPPKAPPSSGAIALFVSSSRQDEKSHRVP